MKPIIHFGLGCIVSLFASVAFADEDPANLPEALLAFAFDPDLPESRYIGYAGGPGANTEGNDHNFRGIGKHQLVTGYSNRALQIDFTHENGRKLSFRIAPYRWPATGKSEMVKVAVFRSPGDEILLAVGGIPAAIIDPVSMRARVVSYKGDDKEKRLTPESLAVFDKLSQPNPQDDAQEPPSESH